MKKFIIILALIISYNVFSTPMLYIVNSFSDNISVIDTMKNQVVTEIKCSVPVYRMIIDKDGKYGYITSTAKENKSQISGLLKIDLNKNVITRKIPLALSAMSNVHLSPGSNFAFVVTAGPAGKRNEIRGKLLVIDMKSSKVVGTILLGLNPLDSVMTNDSEKIFTTDWGSKSVTVVDLIKGRVVDTIPLGNYPARTMALSPDGKQIYLPLEERASSFAQNYNMPLNNMQQTQAPIIQEYNMVVINVDKLNIEKYHIDNLTRPIATVINKDKLYILNVTGTSSKLFEIKIPIADKIEQSEKIIPVAVNMAFNQFNDNLYLIGTDGDKKQEAVVQKNYNSQSNTANQIPNTINDLQQLNKTVTVIDPDTGKVIKVITVGAMPVDGVVK
jgi:YVTN family beta-propeller protein